MSAELTPEPGLPRGMRLHMGIAEQGKLYALAGDQAYARALYYYRRAIQLTVQAGDPEIFFRHYLECVMESLEQTSALAEVLAYCDKAIALYDERPPANPLATADLASIHQRRGAVLLKMGEPAEARAALRSALAVTSEIGRALVLAQTLLRWLDAGYHIDPARVLAEQRRTEYFSVRRETVDAQRAVLLDDERGPQLGARERERYMTITSRGAAAMKTLEQVPLARMVEGLTAAIVDAQERLTHKSIESLERLSDPRNGITLGGESEPRTLLSLGLIPSFLHISEATISVKITFSMAESESLSIGGSAGVNFSVFSASVNAGYASRYSFSVEGSSEFFARVISVPPPEQLLDLLDRRSRSRDHDSST